MQLQVYVSKEMGERIRVAQKNLGLSISELFQEAFEKWDTHGEGSVRQKKIKILEQNLATKIRRIKQLKKKICKIRELATLNGARK